jgi:YfiH family protein
MIAVETNLATGFHAFTTGRSFDGVLKSPWREAGEKLRRLMEDSMGLVPRRIVFAGQVHGNAVATVGDGDALTRIEDVDGLVTAERGVYLVVRTADCLPLVLVEEQARVCAVLHAGWRGSFENILARGVEAMEELGAERQRIRGWIGPAIAGENYEVSEELAESFRVRHGNLGVFTEGRYLDLPRLNALQARGAGLAPDALNYCGLCTFVRDDLFHSHRRQGTLRGHQFTVGGFA